VFAGSRARRLQVYINLFGACGSSVRFQSRSSRRSRVRIRAAIRPGPRSGPISRRLLLSTKADGGASLGAHLTTVTATKDWGS
jgi:hypothetical protein